MKVLVTGSGGFLGRHVVRRLVAEGHNVVALVRPGGSRASDWTSAVVVAEADLRTSRELPRLLEGVEVVVHLAARVMGSDEERFASTVVGTERLLAAMAESSVRRFVLVSSYSVYDWSRATGRLDEASPIAIRPYHRDGYTVAKVWQERIVREAQEACGFELVVLRPGFIWSDEQSEIAGAGVRLGRLLLVFAPTAKLPLTHVTNCAHCVSRAVVADVGPSLTLNVVDGEGVSAWQYSNYLKHLDGSLVRLPVPYRLGLVGARTAQAVGKLLFAHGGKIPSFLQPANYQARFKPLAHSADSAAESLGWQPLLPLEQALEDAKEGLRR